MYKNNKIIEYIVTIMDILRSFSFVVLFTIITVKALSAMGISAVGVIVFSIISAVFSAIAIKLVNNYRNK